jgi:hypothetical protein
MNVKKELPGSKAFQTLQKNLRDIDLLLETHARLTGEGKGRRGPEANVLNRSAIVLGCAAWEAYLEDVCAEACAFLRDKAKTEKAIPDGIKYAVIERLKEDKGESDVRYWRLSDNRWRRSAIKDAVGAITARFQSPSAANADALVAKCLGLKPISEACANKAGKLDHFVELRHEIAHGAAAKVVHKNEVQDFRALLRALAEKIDARIGDHVNDLLTKERAAVKQAEQKRPGRKPKTPRSRRGRPEKLHPW